MLRGVKKIEHQIGLQINKVWFTLFWPDFARAGKIDYKLPTKTPGP